jgi:hypothetical protein
LILNLRLSKQAVFITFICWLAFISTSTGFDFYAHSVSYYFYEDMINQGDIVFGEIVQPRYLLLSLIYELFSRIGVPLGCIASLLLTIPIYHIVKNIKGKKYINSYCRYNLFQYFTIVSLFFFSILYSGLTLVLLWLFAFSLTKRKIFLMGSLFHPIGVVFALIYLFILYIRLLPYYIILLTIFYLLLYIFTLNQIFSSVYFDNIRFHIDINIFDLVLQSYERKKNEFFQLLIIGLIIWLSLGVKKNSILGKLVYVSIGLGNRILMNKLFINVTFIFLYIVFFLYV